MAICIKVEPVARQPQRPTPGGLQVAEIFRRLRDGAGVTQEEMARKIGLTLSGYRSYEQGKRQLRIEQLPTFASAFGLSVERLLAELGIGNTDPGHQRAVECADLMSQLDGEPPEVVETVLRFWRESLAFAKSRARDT